VFIVDQIECGMNYAIAMVTRAQTKEQEIYSWGDNTYKQCGHEFKTKKEKQNN
jgi:alpha-tubulin suppressor-like RCC1 family protein